MAKLTVSLDKIEFTNLLNVDYFLHGEVNKLTFELGFKGKELIICNVVGIETFSDTFVSDLEELCDLIKESYFYYTSETKAKIVNILEKAFSENTFKFDNKAEIMWGK